MKQRPAPSPWPSLIILAAFVVAAIGQCGNDGRHELEDACGHRLQPVTIGGSLVIGCR